MKKQKHFLSVNLSGITQKWFIMDNTNKADGKPYGMVGNTYYDTMKEAFIAMDKLDADHLYNISWKKYEELTSN